MKTLVVIPARFASSRFPGKPLAMLGGKPVIQWVWERVSSMPEVSSTIVATDDQRIVDTVKAFGGVAMLTSDQHRSGTDRCGEVVRRLAAEKQYYDVIINVQGDEPFVHVAQIKSLIAAFSDAAVKIATLKAPVSSLDELSSPNNVKVVCKDNGDALYFSRQPIPYLRGVQYEDWLEKVSYYKHVGIYAFQRDTLLQLVQLSQSGLECAESLEQLRWLAAGYDIKVVLTDASNVGIDTPEDLAAAEKMLSSLV